jgi:hypothetical protein
MPKQAQIHTAHRGQLDASLSAASALLLLPLIVHEELETTKTKPRWTHPVQV